jgi:hypothetical protein
LRIFSGRQDRVSGRRLRASIRRSRLPDEAQSAQLSGGAVSATDHPGYTGSGFVGGF